MPWQPNWRVPHQGQLRRLRHPSGRPPACHHRSQVGHDEAQRQHLYQAVSYAANKGVEWVILTNGAVWRLYRVLFSKPVDQQVIFEVDLLSEEPKPKEKVELFYLLTPEAQRKDELEAYYQRQRALSGANIARLILSEAVLIRLRSVIAAESGYRLALDELSSSLVSSVFRSELQDGEVDKQLKRIQRAAKTPRKPKLTTTVACEESEGGREGA